MFDKSQYDQTYIRENVVRKVVTFNKTKEEDRAVLAWLDTKYNFNAYIRGLILRDMQTGNFISEN